jgi:membrane-associated protein
MEYLDPNFLITTLGLIGIFAIVFAESGILLGMFLPGDSLLFLAGVFASQGHFPLWILILGSIVAAILGDNVGYWFGKKIGPKIFFREESFFFKKSYIKKTQDFYNLHGKKTIAFARFVPIVRTCAPIMAGVGDMNYKTFLSWNIAGGASWVILFSIGGFLLGRIVPEGEHYLTYITFAIVILSVLPVLFQIIKTHFKNKV